MHINNGTNVILFYIYHLTSVICFIFFSVCLCVSFKIICNMLLKIVLLKTFLLMVNSKELLENNTVIVNDSTVEKMENITKSVTLNENLNKNFTIETERIIKPMTSVQLQSQTEQVSKIVNSSQDKPVKEKSAFKASPQLDIQYEYNKFPVVPAFPEAKHFSSLISGNEGNFNSLPWVEKQPKATEEPPWLSRVRFPTAGPPLQQLEHPYPFYNGNSDQIAPPPKLIKPPDSVRNFNKLFSYADLFFLIVQQRRTRNSTTSFRKYVS